MSSLLYSFLDDGSVVQRWIARKIALLPKLHTRNFIFCTVWQDMSTVKHVDTSKTHTKNAASKDVAKAPANDVTKDTKNKEEVKDTKVDGETKDEVKDEKKTETPEEALKRVGTISGTEGTPVSTAAAKVAEVHHEIVAPEQSESPAVDPKRQKEIDDDLARVGAISGTEGTPVGNLI